MSGIHRVTPDSRRGRQMQVFRGKRDRSKYKPHASQKEYERSFSFRMCDIYPCGMRRSAPIMVRFIAPPLGN